MIFGFVKPHVDAHTLGVASMAGLLKESGYEIHISPVDVSKAVENVDNPKNFKLIKQWILQKKINSIGFSYRLDPHDAFYMFSKLISLMDNDSELKKHKIQKVTFAGLPKSCELVKQKFANRFDLFVGDESPLESLRICGVPNNRMPKWLLDQSSYDSDRWELSRRLIEEQGIEEFPPLKDFTYPRFKTRDDTILERVTALQNSKINLPLLRAHVGPYSENRLEALAKFQNWLKELDKAGHLDIVSVGASQLTQEMFGENWDGIQNGGGVPVNSEKDFEDIRSAAGGMLVRSYSATKNIPSYSEMLERTLNTAWHALSFWWFNLADGRGPLSVYETLTQHINALRVIAQNNKPFEPNISHHFSFRGSDDLSGIVATFLAVKMAKKTGIKAIILQMMLNTPKMISGIGDIAKFRVLLSLVEELKDEQFKIIPQPRAGLSYFSPNLEKAKIQLGSVSMLMTDLLERKSPEIIHVVSYSEAVELASPQIINKSAQITRRSISSYLSDKDALDVFSPSSISMVTNMHNQMFVQAKAMINHMEKNFSNLYSPEGYYNIYKAGYFPVPQLWHCRDEFRFATNWKTRIFEGQMLVSDSDDKPMSIDKRLGIIESNIQKLKTNKELK